MSVKTIKCDDFVFMYINTYRNSTTNRDAMI